MYFEPRLWAFTQGNRLRIVAATLVGLASVGAGIARLALLGWLIGLVFAGRGLRDLALPALLVAAVMLLRGGLEYARTMVAHETASRVQRVLRRTLYDRIVALGPGAVGRQRSGALTLSLIDGVDQLETYFGQFLPHFLVALLSPVLIFAVIGWFDLPVAGVMVAFALIALFAPALWHRLDARYALELNTVHSRFAAEFLDAIQGLTTLKAFGQSGARGDRLAVAAHAMFQRTMRVLSTNVAAGGITDSAIACGAAAALMLGTYRVESGAMSLSVLLIILLLGTEIFRPMRELRTVLHRGMVGMAAARGIYAVLDDRPEVADRTTAVLDRPLSPEIAFESVRFRYPGNTRIVHERLDFSVAAGERVGIVGASGGGKSSIVRLLLRFFDPEAGTIRLGGHDLRGLSFDQLRGMVSVVNQDTFLFHGTVEDNIRMGRPDAPMAAVEAAARAANIHDFIVSLHQGYQTIVGEKGVRLSGGQRQRVAIARALLRDAPILVLDEALSAVDAENEAVIQQALDRLMRGRTTLVLAHRLSSIIGCDRVLVLDGGRVIESGPHGVLMAAGGIYARLMAEQVRDSAAGERIIDGAFEPADAAAATIAAKPLTEGIIKAEGLSWPRLVTELMRLVLPWKGRLAVTFACGVLRVVAIIGVGVLSALAILHLRHGQPVGGLLWALAIVAPLAGVLHWLESWIAHDMAFRLLAEMRLAVFRKLDVLAPAYLARRRTGDLLALATNDIELVEYFFAHTVAPAFVAVLVPTVVLGMLAWANPWLALALLPFLAAVALSPFLRRGRVDRLGSDAREAAGELGAFAVDTVQGLAEIVAFQHEAPRGGQLDALSDRYIRLRLPFFAELTGQQSLLEIFTGLGGLAVTVTGAALVSRGAIDAGILPLLTILAMAAFLPVSEIAQVGRQLADTLGATRRIYGLHNEPVAVVDGDLAVAPLATAALTLEGVSFAYPGQTRRALNGIELAIPAGQTIALVGTSGAGKTTLAQLLMRFWDPDDGRITLNGIDLRDYRLDELRRRIALVAQDTYLFNDTLANNIRLARPEASEAELQHAVEQASLGDLVELLPEGLNSPVGERGTALSGGQRQRVAIARAFLKDAPVLILDEATSHLDALNERAVRRALDCLRADRTTIVIAHRLSTVRDADLIVVLDRGRLVETGTHLTLLSQGGLYAQLVGRQLTVAAE